MRKIVLMMVVVFGLMMMGCDIVNPCISPTPKNGGGIESVTTETWNRTTIVCKDSNPGGNTNGNVEADEDPNSTVSTNNAVSSGASDGSVLPVSRAMDMALDFLVDPNDQKKEEKEKVIAIIEKTPELYEKPVQDFKAVIKASFETIDDSFDNKTKEAAKDDIKNAYDDGKGGGFKIVASIAPTEEEIDFYERLKPWVYSSAHENYLETAEELLKFYNSNIDYFKDDDGIANILGNEEYKALSEKILSQRKEVTASYYIQNQNQVFGRERDALIRKDPVAFRQNPDYRTGQIIGYLSREVPAYYKDYTVKKHGISFPHFFENREEYDRQGVIDAENELAEDEDAPVLLRAVFKMWLNADLGISRDYSGHHHTSWRSFCLPVQLGNGESDDWDLEEPGNVKACLVMKIEASKRVIASMKIVREALDVMFK